MDTGRQLIGTRVQSIFLVCKQVYAEVKPRSIRRADFHFDIGTLGINVLGLVTRIEHQARQEMQHFTCQFDRNSKTFRRPADGDWKIELEKEAQDLDELSRVDTDHEECG